jgi:hypothetical protein
MMNLITFLVCGFFIGWFILGPIGAGLLMSFASNPGDPFLTDEERLELWNRMETWLDNSPRILEMNAAGWFRLISFVAGGLIGLGFVVN